MLPTTVWSLDEQGEIVHNSGQLISAAGAIRLATSWVLPAGVAAPLSRCWPRCAMGEIIKCAMRQVRPCFSPHIMGQADAALVAY